MGCPDIVQVWKVNLGVEDWRQRLATLSIEERDRTGRFVFEHDQMRFVVARAALRNLLASLLHVPPNTIRLSVQPGGKPCLADPNDEMVRFNVSHSENLALIAISREREVGIDVERIRPLSGFEDIAMRYFAPAERRAIRRAEAAERLALFYRYWTLKEAYLKAEGLGMRARLDSIDVSTASADPIVLAAATPSDSPRGWSIQALDAEPGYAAALAVGRRGCDSLVVMDLGFYEVDWRSPLTTTPTLHTVGTFVPQNG